MYTLDFETIRQVMQAHQKTGSLHAEVSAGVVSLREPCHVEINIMAGAVVSCIIVGNSGQRLTGEKAIRELFRLGQLSWTFTSQQEAVTQLARPALAPGEILFFPRRIARLERWEMSRLSRLHRMIFALADGTKSAAKIAEILSISSELVNKTLNNMQSMGIIAMIRQDGKNHS
jgi:biotin operon repressor